MCYPVKCKKCNKTTWRGCGKHIDQVMTKVPDDEKCKCEHENEQNKGIFPVLTKLFGY
jgi:hypothetical protein